MPQHTERMGYGHDAPLLASCLDAADVRSLIRFRRGTAQRCGAAYVGAGAHGRNGFYRYYVCRTRQAKGARACAGQRLPADDLEAAVIDDLLRVYQDLDLFEEAIPGAYEDTEQERPRLEAELASAQALLRETTSALDRYLRAFEAGTMPDTV